MLRDIAEEGLDDLCDPIPQSLIAQHSRGAPEPLEYGLARPVRLSSALKVILECSVSALAQHEEL
jgi:hypothetical protein